jgi:carbon-monoxide dehydrogenase medium subunit
MTNTFDYARPDTLQGLLAMMAEGGTSVTAVAGGTDLLVDMRAGLKTPGLLVDIKGIADLHELAFDPGKGLSIGACVTVNELISHEAVQRHYAILRIAGAELATHALRNRATVAGNIVTASPCGDMSSPLLCLAAEVEIASVAGVRRIPFSEFIQGVKKTVLAPEELVTRVLVPADFADARAGYEKLKRIKGHDLGVVAVALIKKEGTMRVAVSSAAPTPVLLKDFPEDAPADEVVAEAHQRISPIDDVRCTKEYRSFMVEVFVRRLIEEVR